ncbi:alkaline phosphatase [Thioalkalivibrio sp. XN8]|uniref:alkaline phosphatase n=1 Tax=Thioalkalivibrio sp. XN8 TaxID=2712863 RepID=UPI001981CCAF|nr:alkaline phosphatase [Thioalkalivibrio sp. XN8]
MRHQRLTIFSLTAITTALLAVAMSAQAKPPAGKGYSMDNFPPAASGPAAGNGKAHGKKQLRRGPKGNVIFIHPDGTGPNHFAAGRMYWEGPDAVSAWDKLPNMASYRGHMTDRLTGTSNGGATVHAFGYKVLGPGSFGRDGGEPGREILALSGYPGSILREAANKGHPTGVVNDGDLPEPGTGAFFAEVADRGESNEIARQLIDGRPGFEYEDRPLVVAMGGGEGFFLPEGTPFCTDVITPDCAVHIDQVSGSGPDREDGRNLVQEAIDAGWIVLRTRQEFDDFRVALKANPRWKPRVLGLFARDDIFNDRPEEVLLALDLVDDTRSPDDKRGAIITHGSKPGTLGYNPPTAAEMTEVAIEVLDRWSRHSRKPFYLVTEVESTDNMGNNNNAIGTLVGLDHSNGVIQAALDYLRRNRKTLIVTAADSDAGGMQVVSTSSETAGSLNYNPTGDSSENVPAPLDGIEGRGSATFVAEPDQFGQELRFAISWISTPDVAGGIVSRAAGLNARLLNSALAPRFDSLDIYRISYLTLFGEELPFPEGELAPDRF